MRLLQNNYISSDYEYTTTKDLNMLGCFSSCLPLYQLYRRQMTEYTQNLCQMVNPPKRADQLIQTSNSFRNYTSRDCAQAFKVSIQLVDQSHFNFYTIEQWSKRVMPGHGMNADQNMSYMDLHLRGTVQIFPETGAIWVRWRQSLYQHMFDLRSFTLEEFATFMEMLNDANAPIRFDILSDFQNKISNHHCYQI